MGERVLIIGGGRGIGLAAAEYFAEADAAVVINDLSSEVLAGSIEELLGRGRHVDGVQGSVANKAGCEGTVKDSVGLLGGIDVLVNCAGVYRQGASTTEEEWDLTVDVNLRGSFFMAMAAMPHLEKSGGNIALAK